MVENGVSVHDPSRGREEAGGVRDVGQKIRRKREIVASGQSEGGAREGSETQDASSDHIRSIKVRKNQGISSRAHVSKGG